MGEEWHVIEVDTKYRKVIRKFTRKEIWEMPLKESIHFKHFFDLLENGRKPHFSIRNWKFWTDENGDLILEYEEELS